VSRLECWTSILGNALLGTVKLLLGMATGSIALTADAAHTYGDMVSQLAENAVTGFHALRVFSSDRELSVDLHLTVRDGLPVEQCHRIEHDLADALRKRMGAVAVNVHSEPASRQPAPAR
jgi:divalent metal cation (Fe/Co/Zn/Cd) transporter